MKSVSAIFDRSTDRPGRPLPDFRYQVANRMLKPLPGHVVSQIDLYDRRQPGKKKAVGMTFAAEKPANESRRVASTADLHRRQLAGQVPVQVPPALMISGARPCETT